MKEKRHLQIEGRPADGIFGLSLHEQIQRVVGELGDALRWPLAGKMWERAKELREISLPLRAAKLEKYVIRTDFRAKQRGRHAEWCIKVRRAFEDRVASGNKLEWRKVAEWHGIPDSVDLGSHVKSLRKTLKAEKIRNPRPSDYNQYPRWRTPSRNSLAD